MPSDTSRLRPAWSSLLSGAFAVLCLMISGACSSGAKESATAAEQLPEQVFNPHVKEGQTHPPYNSRPATSGWHLSAVVKWGVHDVEIPDEYLVHNLEHGGIGIHYDCPDGCDQLVDDLSRVARRYDKVVMTPYSDMDSRVALTAWTYTDRLDEFDEGRIVDFIEAHMSRPPAPEYSVSP